MPTCYFDRKKLGYKLVNSVDDKDIEKYGLARMDQRVKHPYLGSIDNLIMTIEYLGENIIRVKVKRLSKI